MDGGCYFHKSVDYAAFPGVRMRTIVLEGLRIMAGADSLCGSGHFHQSKQALGLPLSKFVAM